MIAESSGLDDGLHPLVRCVSVKLSAPGRNDGGAWCIGGSFNSESLGDPVSTLTGKDFQKA